MSANFMGGPRVALARIRDSRKQKLQQNALAQGATGATTAAAGASTRRADDAKGAELDGLANSSKGKRQASQSGRDTTSNSKKRRKEEADDVSRGRSIDSTANKRGLDEEGGSRQDRPEQTSADDNEDKAEHEQQHSFRSTSPDLDHKRRLLLDHEDWLCEGEIEGILRKKRKKGESSRRKKEMKVTAAAAPGEAHDPDLGNRRNIDRGERDVAGHDRGENRRDKDASEVQAHQVVTSSRRDDQDAGKSSSTTHERASPTKLQQHPHASEPLLPTKGLPALSLHPEALYTNSIKGLFTSGALSKGAAMTSSVEARFATRGSPLEEKDASKAVNNAAKPTLEEAPRRNGGQVAEAGADGELEELEGLLSKQREDTRRRLLGGD